MESIYGRDTDSWQKRWNWLHFFDISKSIQLKQYIISITEWILKEILKFSIDPHPGKQHVETFVSTRISFTTTEHDKVKITCGKTVYGFLS